MNYQAVLKEIEEEVKPFQTKGKIATYIPELANVDPNKFGVFLTCLNGQEFALGDSDEKFSIQSISKVFSLALGLKIAGKKIWERIDVEPSGDPFNSLVQLEYENGIPRNPLINAGAIVMADILISHLPNPKEDYLKFIQETAACDQLQVNDKVMQSEKQWGYRNAALANLLKSFKNIKNDVEEVLDFYFFKCSIEMTCRELSRAFLLFANHGQLSNNEERILTKSQTKRINAIMQTCGFYDEAGEFAFKVGLPGKSGVGGGIVAVYPQYFSISVWAPKLNPKGNSVLGMKVLELFTSKTGLSIF